MASMRAEDRLVGDSNLNTWKARVMNLLEEYDLDGYITSVIEEPFTNVGRANYNRNQAKPKRVIFDSVKDYLMLVITPLNTAKELFYTLVNLYEMKDPSEKTILKNKFHTVKMEKDVNIAFFFTNISHLRYYS